LAKRTTNDELSFAPAQSCAAANELDDGKETRCAEFRVLVPVRCKSSCIDADGILFCLAKRTKTMNSALCEAKSRAAEAEHLSRQAARCAEFRVLVPVYSKSSFTVAIGTPFSLAKRTKTMNSALRQRKAAQRHAGRFT